MSRLDEIKARLAAASPGPWRALAGAKQRAQVAAGYSSAAVPLQGQIEKLQATNERLETDNKALRVSGTELKALYDERLARYEDLADGVADQLEKLGFRVFAPGADVCDND